MIREAQSVAGRTDLKLRRNGSPEVLIVEVKIWGRNDYSEAQRQVEAYWTPDVSLGVVVQLTDADLPNWAERYRQEILESLGHDYEMDAMADSPIRARIATTSSISDMAAAVDHYLVALPRRR